MAGKNPREAGRKKQIGAVLIGVISTIFILAGIAVILINFTDLGQSVAGEWNPFASKTPTSTSTATSTRIPTITSTSTLTETPTITLSPTPARPSLTLTGHSGEVFSLVFSPNGKMLASAAADDSIILWDLASREPVHTLELDTWEEFYTNMAFSPNGRTLVSSTPGRYFDDSITVWWVETGRALLTLVSPPGVVAFSPDGATLAVGGACGMITLYSTDNWTQTRDLNLCGTQDFVAITTSTVFSPDGRMIAVGYDGGAIVQWNLETNKYRTLTGNGYTVAFWPDRNTLASASNDGTINLWDAEGEWLRTLTSNIEDVTCVAYPPEGTIVASASGNVIILWDAATGDWLYTLDVPGGVTSLAFSPDGNILASGSGDGAVILWDVTP